MYRILELLVEDFGDREPSAEYQLMQQKLSEVEKPCKNLDDFAEFLFENLKKYF